MQTSMARAPSVKAAPVLRLCEGISLRRLENYFLYNKVKDELYEIDEEACNFLKKCDGASEIAVEAGNHDFVNFCLSEGILKELKEPGVKKDISVYSSEITPSLRYLELIVTDKCNLCCQHCYIKKEGKIDLSIMRIAKILDEFENAGGIRLMVSGGEPLLHRDFKVINELVIGYDFRSILLTNGTLLNKYIVSELNFDEVQISIDGLEKTHDNIRGKGSFSKSIASIRLLLERGIDVSVATMVLNSNKNELGRLNDLIKRLGVSKWTVDVPCAVNEDNIFLGYKEAGEYFKYGLTSGLYSSSKDYACGANLVAVMNNGSVSKCSFFADKPVGDVSEGLINNFVRLKKIKLDELECDCDYVEECRGGCRYRAVLDGGIHKKDPAKCSFYLQNDIL